MLRELKLVLATKEDAEELWRMQVEAFSEMLARYQDYDMSPAAEPVEKVLGRLEQPETSFYFIVMDGEKVGAIRIWDRKDGTTRKRVSPLFIMPQHRNKGIAQWALSEVERIHGNELWELDTILQEEGNCHLYEKMGYHTIGLYREIKDGMTIVYYHKN